MMIVINFARPLSTSQLQEIESLTGKKVNRVVKVRLDVDFDDSIQGQIGAVLDSVPIDWAADDIVVNVPSMGVYAAVIMAEIHRRRGSFPGVVQMAMRPEGAEFPRQHVVDVAFPGRQEGEEGGLKVVNFDVPLSAGQIRDIERLAGKRVDVIADVSVSVDFSLALQGQIGAVLDSVPIDWAADDYVVNVPCVGITAALVVAEIRKRRGTFPPVLQLANDSIAAFPEWSVADIVAL